MAIEDLNYGHTRQDREQRQPIVTMTQAEYDRQVWEAMERKSRQQQEKRRLKEEPS